MADILKFPDLAWVRGPYPVRVGEVVPVPPGQRSLVVAAQSRLGLNVDGELGPMTWCAIAAENEQRKRGKVEE